MSPGNALGRWSKAAASAAANVLLTLLACSTASAAAHAAASAAAHAAASAAAHAAASAATHAAASAAAHVLGPLLEAHGAGAARLA